MNSPQQSYDSILSSFSNFYRINTEHQQAFAEKNNNHGSPCLNIRCVEISSSDHDSSEITDNIAKLSKKKDAISIRKNIKGKQRTVKKKSFTNKSLISSDKAQEIYSRLLALSRHTESTKKKKWTRDEEELYYYAVITCLRKKEELGSKEIKDEDWIKISSLIPTRTPKQCEYKWTFQRNVAYKKKVWTNRENEALTSIILKSKEPKNWLKISNEFNSLNGTANKIKPKQCRERWNNCLNPAIKREEWSNDEDLKLISLVKKMGKKWSVISKEIQGRTEHAVKNRYNFLISKEKEEHTQIKKMSIGDNEGFSSIITNVLNKQETKEDKILDIIEGRIRTSSLFTQASDDTPMEDIEENSMEFSNNVSTASSCMSSPESFKGKLKCLEKIESIMDILPSFSEVLKVSLQAHRRLFF